ncbi:hypothetical protein GCM10009535_47440 [Streptomyces thermocarboxydovorans]|uniref:Uncharacterized protein n=1 Tax=Streptomyces thermocarboxydovorans TaxID=59298 RepID=A0ABN1HPZ7_9ACTN
MSQGPAAFQEPSAEPGLRGEVPLAQEDGAQFLHAVRIGEAGEPSAKVLPQPTPSLISSEAKWSSRITRHSPAQESPASARRASSTISQAKLGAQK